MGVVVWVAVGVVVAVGMGEGEGEFVGVRVGANDAVGTRVGTGVDSTLQPEIQKSKGAMIQDKYQFLKEDVSCILFYL